MFIGMEWLDAYKTKLDCYHKTLECVNLVLVRRISTLQMKKYCRKGCPLYAINMLESVEDEKSNLEDHPILGEYRDVFPEEVSGLPSRRDIEFMIELAPGVVLVSRTPYRMSTPELVELKL